MPECLIGLGSNLGSRLQILEDAIELLERHVKVSAKSNWFSYPAVGGPAKQADFLNGAVLVDTENTPHQLAQLLHDIEDLAGRQRKQRWASRTLDCDLLLFGSEQIVSKSLTVPHPRMMTRRFVLEPSVTIAPEMVHPRLGWTIRQLHEHLAAPPYFAVIGPNEGYCLEVAQEIARSTQGMTISLAQLANTPGSTSYTPLEFAKAARNLLELSMLESPFPSTPVISTFCHGFGTLEIAVDEQEPPKRPKLVIVTEPIESEFSLRLELSQLRVPTVYLSSDRAAAMQDAVGAVLAMN